MTADHLFWEERRSSHPPDVPQLDRAVILAIELSDPAEAGPVLAACDAADAIGFVTRAGNVTAWVKAVSLPTILSDSRIDPRHTRISLPPTTTLTPDEIELIYSVFPTENVRLLAPDGAEEPPDEIIGGQHSRP